ncbi:MULTISPECIES: mechanosensitive ion channel family protein [unclassified Fusibacter]|uniref:mechanosensitive ion channel family protein n=1 Tax=unclassified Fusibacter TaxID=2624464 RepID=UPI0010122A19|nr:MULTISPECIES: mechanosensitive ion channel family protein [unclassified Fusibacter]MCK8061374.1 mechanosensitive ion channel family protein [Fusibacter sp. A2]NPE23583.1 mechanosensitive ion channel family protein [Fusibacter sp. A1]RXV58992.1 mechanosensitive ion channel family protein [Fusibacter sp. A1]
MTLFRDLYWRSYDAFMMNLWGQKLVLALGILLVTFIARKFVSKWIFNRISKMAKKTKYQWDDILVTSFKKPLDYFITFTGVYFAVLALPLSISANLMIALVFKILFIVLVAYGVYKMEGFYGHLFAGIGNRLNVKRSNLLRAFTIKIFRAGTVVLAGVLILDLLGFDISTFVAGLGLAGLALALAAQDTLQNVFAGVTIIFDKPFDVGDRILSNGIDGVVEDINFRSTRIRTLELEYVTIPNSNISNNAIVNFTKRDERKVKMHIGCLYSTKADSLKIVIENIRETLMKDPEVITKSINVNLDTFGESSIDILVMYLTATSDWNRYLEIKERINFEIMTIMETAGVDFAFPSQSLYFENPLRIEQKTE